MESMASLFLSQSYKDAWEDYIRSLNRPNFIRWDYILLTASNEQQAEGFRMQLEERRKAGLLPSATHFAVLPDPEGKRVGSGGATLNVLRYITEQESGANFRGKRILVIHSGGDSRRVPQYSALGKLFSPVPRELPNGRASTLFDEFLIGMSGVPGRMKDGMLLLSGDVMLLFNPLQIDFSGAGAAAISFKEDVETGKNHGVYLMGENGNVAEFLHKQSVETLRAKGAVNEGNCVDIDTGAVIFSSEMLLSLYGLMCADGVFSAERFDTFVNEEVRLSLYGDFLYPLAERSTLEAFYQEKPEGSYCEALHAARTEVWQALRQYRMRLLRLSPAKFVHFGTTREVMQLMHSDVRGYEHLGWQGCVNSSVPEGSAAAYGSVMSSGAQCGERVYLEASYVHSQCRIGNRVLLSHVELQDEEIPDSVVLHGLKQKDGSFVARIYGVDDNPKGTLEEKCSFLGGTLAEFLSDNEIEEDELWEEEPHSLWNARLYPVCGDIRSAVAAALNLYSLTRGQGDLEAWRNSERKSLRAGFNDASAEALVAWNRRMQELVRMDRLSKAIDAGVPVTEAKQILQDSGALTKVQRQWLQRRIARAGYGKAVRLYYYLGKGLGGVEGEKMIDLCFQMIRKGILEGTISQLEENRQCRICREEHQVQLPLRVNWGGGWSDTPPYCNEHGGTVLNAAVTLNGTYPVQVTLKRLEEYKVVFDSRDMDSHGEFTDIESLQSCGDPYDPFALQKAALVACGIMPSEGGDLKTVLKRLGGGIFMGTEVTGVPKGSGLGTSSILSGACVKALFEFMGIAYSEDDLYGRVLCMEQIMSTGGGWQDQVGGLSSGVKYITSRPGLGQKLKVEHLQLDAETMAELNERFALIYTGQRRLARNLLRDVVGRYIGNVPDALDALEKIQRTAALMRFELERGNVDGFAQLLNEHWELSQQLDTGSTNTCIDQIFHSIDDLIDGRMICGAGGGGFLQVILKKGVTREALHNRLHEVFQDSGVDVWDCRLV